MDKEEYKEYETRDTVLLKLFLDSNHLIRNKLLGKSYSRILFLLLQHGDMTQSDLLNFRGIRSASLSEALTKMEQNGFIVRTRSEKDKRQMLITITDSGRSLALEHAEERRTMAREIFSVLAPEEKDEVERIIKKLSDFLENQ